MKKILLVILAFLLAIGFAFSQATGYPIANKPTGGAIGTAATTVDKLTTFNVNQTTAGQTITVPPLTLNTSSKIIYIGNTGTVLFSLVPGCLLAPGTGTTLRWDGLQWNVEGCGYQIGGGGGSTNPTSGYMPVNLLGIFQNSPFFITPFFDI